ncbi:MAG TPA: glycogen debranching N-terminal domain-containing protein [Ktedonobacterales bacterium]|jgi:glycogen debranching enzyme|nr:glycogen debranching N-terminal domain-containing protein [Ktedonobacterales bacterium]
MSDILLRVFPDHHFVSHDHSLLITDRAGMITGGLDGLYVHDARLLSRYRLLVHGRPPRLDALSPVAGHSMLAYFFCAPGWNATPEQLAQEEQDRQVVLRVARFVGQGLHEDMEVTNHGQRTARLDFAWELAADFADFLEAGDGHRPSIVAASGQWQRQADGPPALHFDSPHPALGRGMVLRLRGTQSMPRWDGERLSYSVTLGPQQSHTFCLVVAPILDGKALEPVFGCDAFFVTAAPDHDPSAASDPHPGDPAQPVWLATTTRLETTNAGVQQAWGRAVADLSALALGDGAMDAERAVPAAGSPRYLTLFGRDALTVGVQALLATPVVAEGALRLLAQHLGTKDDDFYDEQPGRVLQELRDGPEAILRHNAYLHYYGDYAAPCLFLLLIGAHHMAVGDAEITRQFLDPAERVLAWLEERGDLDGDGFLEYHTRSPQGPTHQGWKDSNNAVVYADGRQVEPPVATCELQGYWYAAKLLMAEVFLALGHPARAFELYRQAEDLKRRFNERFWMAEERFVAFALDAQKRQVTSISSNAGHCLAAGIVDGAHAADVVQRLMAPDMFSGWGIRTLSATNPAFNPFSYHLGSVWPAENATTALGMRRYGFALEANLLSKGIFDAAALFENMRLPETFGGHHRDARHPHPGIYPEACAPQAWSASAVMWLIQAMLGMWSYAPLQALIVDPALPDWLPELTLHELRVGQARVTLRFYRDGTGQTDYQVLAREGTLHVVRQPPPNAPVGPVTRLRELVESLLPGH